IPDPSFEWIKESLKKSIHDWWEQGFTACTGMEMKKDIAYLEKYRKENGLPFRLSWFAPYSMLEEIINMKLVSGDDMGSVKLGGIKLFADGSFGSLTAEVTKPYKSSGSYGIPVMPQTLIENVVKKAHSHNLATAVHAIGDKAIDRVLEAYNLSFEKNSQAAQLRNRVEHVQLPSEKAISQLAKWDIGAAIQPIHIKDDIDIINEHLPDSKNECYPLKTFEKNNVPLIMGSDAPVADIHPWGAIYTAITQADPDNSNRTLNTDQTLTLITALKGYTSTAAYYSYEDKLGNIKENYFADIIILNKNLERIKTPEEILKVKTKTTILNGEIVFNI
ncbi:MAG: amidohydrolase family protein, partial [Calditrichia bacterium]|nr:amidohydrolase family protein [Calditrichia bacterium]